MSFKDSREIFFCNIFFQNTRHSVSAKTKKCQLVNRKCPNMAPNKNRQNGQIVRGSYIVRG
jgi:hypothetical protein